VTVFSNTTPLIALSSVNLLHLLPSIFGSIMVASSVHEECSEGGKIFVPDLATLPWVTVQTVQPNKQLPSLFELDRGERDTLLLALTPGGINVAAMQKCQTPQRPSSTITNRDRHANHR